MTIPSHSSEFPSLRPAELADAISHWMIYKQRCGFDRLLSESMLLMPIAEYFMGHGWAVAAEQDLHGMTQAGKPGAVNYDLVAEERANNTQTETGRARILVELKFLTNKSPYHARIHSDFVKLALATGAFQRLAVVALEPGIKIPNALVECGERTRYSYGFANEAKYHAIGDNTVRKSILDKIKDHDLAELSFDVTCVARDENVAMFSVDRPEAVKASSPTR